MIQLNFNLCMKQFLALPSEKSTLVKYITVSVSTRNSINGRILRVCAGGHWCSAANLRIGIYNGEMVFNRFLGNSWSDLDDFFGRLP